MGRYETVRSIHSLKMAVRIDSGSTFGYAVVIDDVAMDVVREKLIERGYKVNFINFDGSHTDNCSETNTESIRIDWANAGLE